MTFTGLGVHDRIRLADHDQELGLFVSGYAWVGGLESGENTVFSRIKYCLSPLHLLPVLRGKWIISWKTDGSHAHGAGRGGERRGPASRYKRESLFLSREFPFLNLHSGPSR